MATSSSRRVPARRGGAEPRGGEGERLDLAYLAPQTRDGRSSATAGGPRAGGGGRCVGDDVEATRKLDEVGRHKRGEALGNGKDISATQLQKYEAAFDAFLKRSENSVHAEKVRTKQEGLEF